MLTQQQLILIEKNLSSADERITFGLYPYRGQRAIYSNGTLKGFIEEDTLILAANTSLKGL
jgi:hypothetical protein